MRTTGLGLASHHPCRELSCLLPTTSAQAMRLFARGVAGARAPGGIARQRPPNRPAISLESQQVKRRHNFSSELRKIKRRQRNRPRWSKTHTSQSHRIADTNSHRCSQDRSPLIHGVTYQRSATKPYSMAQAGQRLRNTVNQVTGFRGPDR